MADEPHDVVKLLLARMESHPEEFDGGHPRDRWYATLIDIKEYAPAEDAALVEAKVAAIRLDRAHRAVMDELLNGEDRRRKEAEDREYERHLASAAQQSQYGQANQLLNQAYDFDLDKMVGVGTRSPTTKLDVAPSILNSMRRMLK